MKLIPIQQNGITYHAKVNDEDYEWLSTLNWHLSGGKDRHYARHISGKVYMHHLVLLMKRPPVKGSGFQVDHINHDGLDNQRQNLRLVTTAFNAIHRLSPHQNKTGYRGVYSASTLNLFSYKLDRNSAGYFPKPHFAAMARELELRGQFDYNEACNFLPSEIVGASFLQTSNPLIGSGE